MTEVIVGLGIARIVVLVISGVMLTIAAVVGLYRVSKGPTTLDRAVGTDLLLGVLIAGLAIEALVNRHTTSLPIMLVIALIGFAGPVAIARYIPDAMRNDTPEDRPTPRPRRRRRYGKGFVLRSVRKGDRDG